MIQRVELFFRRIRRLISRSERAIRLLSLPESEEESLSPGIVMIQVDGLSYNQLKQALKKKKMPFVRHLLKKEHYQLHHLYSGLPSSTPAVQAELFYGVKGAVPAFSFMDKKSGRIVRMFDPDMAAAAPTLIFLQEVLRNRISVHQPWDGATCFAPPGLLLL